MNKIILMMACFLTFFRSAYANPNQSLEREKYFLLKILGSGSLDHLANPKNKDEEELSRTYQLNILSQIANKEKEDPALIRMPNSLNQQFKKIKTYIKINSDQQINQDNGELIHLYREVNATLAILLTKVLSRTYWVNRFSVQMAQHFFLSMPLQMTLLLANENGVNFQNHWYYYSYPQYLLMKKHYLNEFVELHMLKKSSVSQFHHRLLVDYFNERFDHYLHQEFFQDAVDLAKKLFSQASDDVSYELSYLRIEFYLLSKILMKDNAQKIAEWFSEKVEIYNSLGLDVPYVEKDETQFWPMINVDKKERLKEIQSLYFNCLSEKGLVKGLVARK